MIVLSFLMALNLAGDSSAQKSPAVESVQSGLSTASAEADEKRRIDIFRKMARLSMDTPEDVEAVYDAMKTLHKRADAGADWADLREESEALHRLLSKSTHQKVQKKVAELLGKEESAIAPNDQGPMSRKGKDREIEALRLANLVALSEAAGAGKNEEALGPLREMAEKGGVAADLANRAIARIGRPEDLERMIEKIKADPRARIDLAGFGPQIIDRLMREIDRPGIDDRQKAGLIRRLGHARGPESIDKYRKLLKHRDPRVAHIAAEAVSASVGLGNEDLILQMLNDADRNVRFSGLVSLQGGAWSGRFAPRLTELVSEDPDEGIREEAAFLLGQKRAGGAKAALSSAAEKDKSARVREAAKGALREISGERDKELKKQADDALRRIRR